MDTRLSRRPSAGARREAWLAEGMVDTIPEASPEPFRSVHVWLIETMSLRLPGHDLRLARRAVAGEPAAWREIVDGFGPRIHALAFHFCRDAERAQDLTQEVFLRLFQNLGSYRGDVPLLAWTLRLSRNLCIDDYRRRRRERTFRFLSLDVVIEVADTATGRVLTYHNPIGTPFPPVQDTDAFPTCP